MITKFDNFYGGHVEMDNMGFQGLPVDELKVNFIAKRI